MPILPYDYQKVDKVLRIKQDTSLTDLAVMGVPPEFHDSYPVPEAYPIKFNDDGLVVWLDMLESEEYRAKTRGQTLDGVWHTAIQLFLHMCQDSGISPFDNTTDITRNETVLYAARKHRIQLVQYVNEIGIFKKLRVRVAFREYVRTDDGFIISQWAEMFPYLDETRPEFEAWLTNMQLHQTNRFLRYVDNHFVHVIVPPLQVWVKTINMHRIQMGFTINVKGTVNIPGNKTPTRKEVDAFIDKMWIPTLRAHQFDNNITRLF